MANYDFFQHRKCEYFPCHPDASPESFSCLFCYCPLYALADQCGGNFTYSEQGYKDCTNCLRPHKRENYDGIQKQMQEILEMVKEKPKQEKS